MRFNWLSEYVASISSSIASTSPWRQLQQQVQQLVPNPQAIYCRIRSSSAEALEHVLNIWPMNPFPRSLQFEGKV